MRKSIVVALSLALLITASGFVVHEVARHYKDQHLEQVPFSNNPSLRVQLPPQGIGEEQRLVRYGPDGFTPIDARVYFANGETGLVLYRKDGTVSEFWRYYAAGGSAVAPVKAHVRLDLVGRHWLADEQYRLDGSLARSGLRLDGGDYVVTGRFGDGVVVSYVTSYNLQGVLKSNKTFWENGNPRLELIVKSVIEKSQKTFYTDGSLESELAWLGQKESGSYFYADGKTLRMTYERFYRSDSSYMVSWPVKADYFLADGTLEQRRLFEYGRMTAEFNVAGHQVVQVWKTSNVGLPPDKRLLSENFRLLEVVVDGKQRFVIGDGDVVELHSKETREGVEFRVIRYLLPDGTVFKIEARDPESKVVLLQPAEGEHVDIPYDLMRPVSYQAPSVVPLPSEYVGGPF
ncbi:MAG: hypothetical protein KC777_11090 [Cyanobacteria bacterium HKST-UBA02]|nr:hypothetical protein [Cyanobacteria bacterium HKST-UBA02]